MIRNLHWYANNATQNYPLSDSATATDHNGKRLPNHIIADLNLRFPETAGQIAYVSSVSITPRLVSVTIQAALADSDTTTLVPLAVVSLPMPVDPWRQYPLQSQLEGVGGWIVFGEGISEPYTGRFTAAAGQLCPRAARKYMPLPVSSISKVFNADKLSGIVRLKAEAPLEIVGEDREIEGVLRTVGVVRLVQDANNEVNVFEDFAGPCGLRPETGNCGNPIPIEYINAVQPDCDGNLTIEFKGCAKLGLMENGHGIVIDCNLGMSNACVPDKLPLADGTLQNEFLPDNCEASWYSDYARFSQYSYVSEDYHPLSQYSEANDTTGMDYPLIFTFDLGVATEWKIVKGWYGFGYDGYYSWQPINPYGAHTGQQGNYISTDTQTKGSWLGQLGKVGYLIPGIGNSYPTGMFSANTVPFTGATVEVVENPATGTRSLQVPPAGKTRVSSRWYSATSFSFTLPFVDAKVHDVSLYFEAHDNVFRIQRVDILDMYDNRRLHSIFVRSFQSGVWLHYRMKGGIKVVITKSVGPDCQLNAILLDQTLPYVRHSLSTTQNDSYWDGLNGRNLYVSQRLHTNVDNVILFELPDQQPWGKHYEYSTYIGPGGSNTRLDSEFVFNYRHATPAEITASGNSRTTTAIFAVVVRIRDSALAPANARNRLLAIKKELGYYRTDQTWVPTKYEELDWSGWSAETTTPYGTGVFGVTCEITYDGVNYFVSADLVQYRGEGPPKGGGTILPKTSSEAYIAAADFAPVSGLIGFRANQNQANFYWLTVNTI